MTEKIKQLRDAVYTKEGWTYSDAYRDGFDAAWAIHERLVTPLLEALKEMDEESPYPDNEAKLSLEKYKAEVVE